MQVPADDDRQRALVAVEPKRSCLIRDGRHPGVYGETGHRAGVVEAGGQSPETVVGRAGVDGVGIAEQGSCATAEKRK